MGPSDRRDRDRTAPGGVLVRQSGQGKGCHKKFARRILMVALAAQTERDETPMALDKIPLRNVWLLFLYASGLAQFRYRFATEVGDARKSGETGRRVSGGVGLG